MWDRTCISSSSEWFTPILEGWRSPGRGLWRAMSEERSWSGRWGRRETRWCRMISDHPQLSFQTRRDHALEHISQTRLCQTRHNFNTRSNLTRPDRTSQTIVHIQAMMDVHRIIAQSVPVTLSHCLPLDLHYHGFNRHLDKNTTCSPAAWWLWPRCRTASEVFVLILGHSQQPPMRVRLVFRDL